MSSLGIKQRKIPKLGIKRVRIHGLQCVHKGENVTPGYQRRIVSFHEMQTESPLR